MKTKKHQLYAVVGSLLAVLATGFIWYRMPVRIEDMDRLATCACGYSKVEFKDGKITMVHGQHNEPKPGDVFGSYSTAGRTVTVVCNGKPGYSMKLDHLGLLDTTGFGPKYCAISGRSWKTKVYELLERIGLINDDVGAEFLDQWRQD